MRIAHIINPVDIGPHSDLFIAQPITFESMRRARAMAEQGGVEVELWSTQYAEDHRAIPPGFQKTADLDRSVLDFGTFGQPRKLPVLADILDRLYEHSQADFFIYTNVDIGLQPSFYLAVSRLIERGHDGLIINRRTIERSYSDIEDLPLMQAQLGTDHPGFDCFVFRRDALPNYVLANCCIGAGLIGRVFLLNIFRWARKPLLLERPHLTFHLGNDAVWRSRTLDDFAQHNHREFWSVVRRLVPQGLQLEPKLAQKIFAPVRPKPADAQQLVAKVVGVNSASPQGA